MTVFATIFDPSGILRGVKAAVKSIKEVGEAYDEATDKGKEASESYTAKKTKSEADKAARSVNRLEDAFSSLTKKALAALGGYSLFQLVKDAISAASRYETLKVVVQQVGKVAGYSRGEIEKNVNAIRKMGIAGNEARKTLTQLLQSQVDISKAPGLARVAQNAAVIGGINSTEAFERMVHGIQSAQTDVLRGIGLNVNFENSYKTLAAQLGKTTEELTEQEKVQARVNAVMQAGVQITGTYEASMQTLGKQAGSLKRVWSDLLTDFGAHAMALADWVGDITGAASALQSFLEYLNRSDLIETGVIKGFSRDALEAIEVVSFFRQVSSYS